MAANNTTETDASVEAFINTVEDAQQKADSFKLIEIFKKQTGFEPKMWGPAIIGFGSYHYKYDSGREGTATLAGFSPRKGKISLYIFNYKGRDELMKEFGKHQTAKACVYVKKLADIDVKILEKLIKGSVNYIKSVYP